ncbi:hypothetical protein R3P38DRAFT_3488828 [Favolaschia claudopus]|uniref:Uncharacterized protein n=1 Tax=Favolaschia claudopus TaxID=2862362 RepID=A0AAW0E9K7_9AGAR
MDEKHMQKTSRSIANRRRPSANYGMDDTGQPNCGGDFLTLMHVLRSDSSCYRAAVCQSRVIGVEGKEVTISIHWALAAGRLTFITTSKFNFLRALAALFGLQLNYILTNPVGLEWMGVEEFTTSRYSNFVGRIEEFAATWLFWNNTILQFVAASKNSQQPGNCRSISDSSSRVDSDALGLSVVDNSDSSQPSHKHSLYSGSLGSILWFSTRSGMLDPVLRLPSNADRDNPKPADLKSLESVQRHMASDTVMEEDRALLGMSRSRLTITLWTREEEHRN